MNPATSPSAAPAVHIRDAHLRYTHRALFEGLNLDLAAERFTCLLGTSGSGKTSLLRLVAGLIGSAALHVSVQISCDDGYPLKGRFAWMGQQDLLLPWLTVIDNVLLGAKLRATINPQQRRRAQQQLVNMGLGEYANYLPSALSGGMRQRVALARTLYEDRPVVLMDEPFSALDAVTRHKLQTLSLKWLARRTVLLITHDPMEALRLGHCIHVLQGRPAQPTAALYPEGTPPRELQRGDLSERYAELLQQLAGSDLPASG